MTDNARLVIVGGGIVGAATAYHLTRLHGWRDIIVIDQGPLPYNAGSTSHAPGGIVAASHSKTLTRMGRYSAELYRRLDPVDDKHKIYNHLGGIEICRSSERLEDMKRLHGRAKAWGMDTNLLTPQETLEFLPWFDPSAIAGSLHVPESMLAKGYHLVADLLKRAAGPDEAITAYADTALIDIEVDNGKAVAVTTSNPAVPRIECEQVLLAANVWSPAISAKLGVSVPLMAFEHQYAVTAGLEPWADYAGDDIELEVRYPLVRDLDVAMYYRAHWDGLGIGSYHHGPKMVRPEDMGASALREFTVNEFDDAWKLAQEVVPMLRQVEPEFTTAYNGIFAFSVDGMPIIGPSSVVAGLWSANASWLSHAGGVAKSVAEWMAAGEAEWDMRECYLHRFQDYVQTQQYVDRVTQLNYAEVYDIKHPSQPPTDPRDVRRSPFHNAHEAADVHFVPFAGLELPGWYQSNAPLVDKYRDQIPERAGWGGMYWSPIQGAEHLATRETASLWDLTGLSIIEVSGPEALEQVERLCSNHMDVDVGKVVYTCWLTPRGGVKRDLAVARKGVDTFWMFVGEGTLPMDLDWVRRNVSGAANVVNRSPAYSALGVFGPNALDILNSATNADLTLEAFGYYTAQTIEVAMTPVYAMRISYVGESGFELHIPIDSSMPVWNAIVAAGHDHDMILAGLGAMDSMRLEKGYRLWGSDVHTDYNVYESGLGWTVKLDKGDFIGREASAAAKAAGVQKKLVCLRIDDPGAVVRGYEPLLRDGQVVGNVTSGNYGYSVDHYIAYGYVGIDHATAGTALTVEYFNEMFEATVVGEPVFDASNARMKA